MVFMLMINVLSAQSSNICEQFRESNWTPLKGSDKTYYRLTEEDSIVLDLYDPGLNEYTELVFQRNPARFKRELQWNCSMQIPMRIEYVNEQDERVIIQITEDARILGYDIQRNDSSWSYNLHANGWPESQIVTNQQLDITGMIDQESIVSFREWSKDGLVIRNDTVYGDSIHWVYTYYSDGTLKEAYQVRNVFNYAGEYRRYHKNGVLAVKGQFDSGNEQSRIGIWYHYTKDSNLLKTVDYSTRPPEEHRWKDE